MSNKVRKCCSLLAVALVLLAASVTHANGQQAVELLNQICAGKKVDLATVSQVRLLIEQLRSEQRPAACSETAADSILELENVLSKANVCSKEATDEIGRYQLKYVYEKSEFSNELPDAIRSFFLAYGFRASKLCKESFLSSLNEVTERHILQNDRQIVTFWTQTKNDWVSKFMGTSLNLEDLFLLTDFSALTNSSEGTRKKIVTLNIKAKLLHDELKSRCLNKFRPIYEQLVLPIVRLSALGLNYKEKSLKKRMELFKLRESYKYWYKIVFLCESMLNVDVLLARVNKKIERFEAVAILDEEEAAELKGWAGLAPEQPEALNPISFERSVTIEPNDTLIDPSDKYIKKSIRKFNAKCKETERLQKHLLRHVLHMLSAMMRSGKITFGLGRQTKYSRSELEEAIGEHGYSNMIGKVQFEQNTRLPLKRKSFWARNAALITNCITFGLTGIVFAGAIVTAAIAPPIVAVPLVFFSTILAGMILIFTKEIIQKMTDVNLGSERHIARIV